MNDLEQRLAGEICLICGVPLPRMRAREPNRGFSLGVSFVGGPRECENCFLSGLQPAFEAQRRWRREAYS
jgi:hypothetical protein